MKTAEEWYITKQPHVSIPRDKKMWLSIIQQIQLDAFKAGMTEAAEIVHPTFEKYLNIVEPWLGLHDSNLAESLEKAILSARDRKESL